MNVSMEFPSIVLNLLEVKNSVTSFELSTKYLSRFTRIAMLNIINRRIQVPETEFIEKTAFDEIPYVVFKRKSQNPFIKAFHRYASGIIDALEKGFLRELQILIVNKNTKEILECYLYKYEYNHKKKDQPGNKDPEKVRNAMLLMLSVIKELPGDKWPENDVDLLCEITYQRNTPATYEPPYFGPSQEIMPEDPLFEFSSMGKINTGFHKLSAYGKGVNFEAFRVAEGLISEAAAVAVEQQSMEEGRVSLDFEPGTSEENNSKVNSGNSQTSSNKRGSVDAITSEITENPSKKAKSVLNESFRIPSPVSSEALEVCICGWRNLDERFKLIKCNKCQDPVHLACHGFIHLQDADVERFICLICRKKTGETTKARSQLRLVLYGILLDRSLPSVLRKATRAERKKILDKLELFGVIQPGSTQIDEDALGQAIEKRFVAQRQNSAYLRP